ncbi:hypothetical protein PIROE2DRAFT_63078 [Piromyces sp. E2]|nr:hypothetical protein PIROE2DRAFT_63078 [Piromyces sp. E2]|eukprot:OUM60557.1 hypothetical protein PIROE2DRAFT_63078 [Piromyces sp. E2]
MDAVEKTKLDRINKLQIDMALGQSGIESELFYLTKEFKESTKKEFYTSKMLYAQFIISGLRDTLEGNLMEIRRQYKSGKEMEILKKEEQFKKELYNVLTGKIKTLDELIECEINFL